MFEAWVVAVGLRSELGRLRVDGRDRALGELVDLVGECQSVINQATALQTLAMAHLAAIEDVALEDGTVVEQHRGLGHQRLDAPALVSDQLGVSDASASSRMTAAVEVVTRVPGVFETMGEGRLDEYRARIVSDELRDAPPRVCAEVVARIAESLGSEPPAVLRRRVRRALGAVDADLLRAKADRARSERSLCRWPGDEPGVDTWMGSFPAEQSRSGWGVVDGLARQYVRDGRATGLSQARADALMDLIHARATGTFVVQLAVPADQFAARTQPGATPEPAFGPSPAPTKATTDAAASPAAVETGSAGPAETVVAAETDIEDDELVTVAGLGMPGTTQVRRGWLTILSDTADTADSATEIGPAVRHEVVACDADTGALLAVRTDLDQPGRRGRERATESKAYRPAQTLIDLVKARDGRCRFPGCTVNARFCDVDHVTPWPVGPTHPTNLMCLCRRHHRIKQSIRWRVRIDPDATVTWTDPTGRLRTTLPLDFLQLDTRHRETNPPKTFVSTPRDTPDARWSAWEEELAHELTRAERHRVRHGPHTSRADEPLGRPVLPAELSAGLDAFSIDPAFAESWAGRGRRRVTRAEGDPPF